MLAGGVGLGFLVRDAGLLHGVCRALGLADNIIVTFSRHVTRKRGVVLNWTYFNVHAAICCLIGAPALCLPAG